MNNYRVAVMNIDAYSEARSSEGPSDPSHQSYSFHRTLKSALAAKAKMGMGVVVDSSSGVPEVIYGATR